jgi:hypothetical protein
MKPRSAGRAGSAAWVAVLFVAACADASHGLLSGTSAASVEIQQACAFATRKCTHCHPIERVVLTRGVGLPRWQMYIEQMRRKPSSGISLSDADVIFRCLRFVEEACIDCKRGRS